MCDDVIINI